MFSGKLYHYESYVFACRDLGGRVVKEVGLPVQSL